MTPADVEALCARLEDPDCHDKYENINIDLEAAAALRSQAATLRSQAGEIERLKLHYKGVPHDWVAQELYDALQVRVRELEGDLNIARLQRDAKLCSQCPRTGELDAMRAENERLKKSVKDHWTEIEMLTCQLERREKENEALVDELAEQGAELSRALGL